MPSWVNEFFTCRFSYWFQTMQIFTSFHFSEFPVEFTKPLKDSEVMENQTMTLTCEVNKPDLEAKWTKDGKPLVTSDRVKVICEGHTHSVEIAETVLEDDSVYKCVVKDKKTSARLTVKGLLEIMKVVI